MSVADCKPFFWSELSTVWDVKKKLCVFVRYIYICVYILFPIFYSFFFFLFFSPLRAVLYYMISYILGFVTARPNRLER